ncbi:hypothetical protein IMZ48_24085 [Candidatus Bathyarchaeota archaeon]|nr:hypothetical protein [Candidatus Bathyarchaeota archaeon]
MQLSALILAALASFTLAQSKDKFSKIGYVCETTIGSPLLHHVDTLIENMSNVAKDDKGAFMCMDYSLGAKQCETGTIIHAPFPHTYSTALTLMLERGYSDNSGAVIALCPGKFDTLQAFRVSSGLSAFRHPRLTNT